ncbi:MAG: Crp/Fnr family transcriptional regulator [Proteobacteria bacterium]|nr:MAG: Crp/Fnr family transcriptional regulator [Pseudomonadota bacterium]
MGVNLTKDQRKLLACFKNLSSADQASLINFAEFLVSRSTPEPAEARSPAVPVIIPRPVDETVPKAIKRLSQSYPMLDDVELLHRCSALMSEHILQGRPSCEVIDELELLYQQSFQLYQTDNR